MLANEKQLAQRAATRGPLTFAKLYDYYVEKIYRYVYYRCDCADQAEDLTAQVFLEAWEALGNYRREGHPLSRWLYRMARKKVIDYYRTHRETLTPHTARAQESGLDPPDGAERAMTAGEVHAALKNLAWNQQEVLILRFVEGYSTAEVAAIMGKRPEAIRVIQHRALRALQPRMASQVTQARIPLELSGTAEHADS